MPRILSVLSIAIACTSCGRSDARATPAEAYIHWQDKIAAATGLPLTGPYGPCNRVEKSGDESVFVRLPTDQCVKMLPPQRWRGIWQDHVEGQIFCPGATKECPDGGAGIWLDHPVKERGSDRHFGGVYAVDFIGRRTKYKGAYGHMGGSDYLVAVDRMISIKQIEAPPKE